MPNVIVLGLGNDLLTDDAVGLHVTAEVRHRLGNDPDIAVKSSAQSGSALLDLIVDHTALVVVDSVQTGLVAAGHIHVITPAHFPRPCTRSPHALGIEETCALGRSLGMDMPEHVCIFAVEIEDSVTVGTEMTPAVQHAIETTADRVIECARRFARKQAPHKQPT